MLFRDLLRSTLCKRKLLKNKKLDYIQKIFYILILFLLIINRGLMKIVHEGIDIFRKTLYINRVKDLQKIFILPPQRFLLILQPHYNAKRNTSRSPLYTV